MSRILSGQIGQWLKYGSLNYRVGTCYLIESGTHNHCVFGTSDSLAPGPAVDCQTPASVLDTEHISLLPKSLPRSTSPMRKCSSNVWAGLNRTLSLRVSCAMSQAWKPPHPSFSRATGFCKCPSLGLHCRASIFSCLASRPFAALRLHMLKTYGQWLGEAGECTKYTKLDIPLESARFRPTL
ncbi:hypothetical protein BCR44DRAFT_253528, partial [Catenaria anguillulae PL171]